MDLYKSDKYAYEVKAEEWTQKYALVEKAFILPVKKRELKNLGNQPKSKKDDEVRQVEKKMKKLTINDMKNGESGLLV